MSSLVRKITIEHWPDGDETKFSNLLDLQADSIADLLIGINDNELSWWKIDDLGTDLLKVAAAICSKSKGGIQAVNYFVVLDFDNVKEKFAINHTPDHADININDISIKQKHYDISNLTYKLIGDLAELVANITSSTSEKICRINSKDILNYYIELENEGVIELTAFPQNIQNQIKSRKRKLNKTSV